MGHPLLSSEARPANSRVTPRSGSPDLRLPPNAPLVRKPDGEEPTRPGPMDPSKSGPWTLPRRPVRRLAQWLPPAPITRPGRPLAGGRCPMVLGRRPIVVELPCPRVPPVPGGHLPRWLVSREASPRAGSRMGPPGRASAPVVGSVSGRPSPQPGPARRRSGPPPAAGSATTTSARHGRPAAIPLLLGPRSRAAGVVQPGGREAGPGHLIGRPA
jgi:hypothetical protein